MKTASRRNAIPARGFSFTATDPNVKIKNGKIIVLIILMAAAYFIHKDKWAWSDRYAIWRNPPSPAVVELADKTVMNALARRIFFASVPSIDDAEDINVNCADIETTLIILGCHARGRIHVFNVRDKRIIDAKYVTSAHEMLHAAYARLSKNERAKINRLLEEAYQQVSEDSELRGIMAEYLRTKPELLHNELHSILGTEHAGLSPELEKYYARYFVDRNIIIEMSIRYRDVFNKLEAEQARLKVLMDRLAESIRTDASILDTLVLWLNTDIDAFNNREFYSMSEFNEERRALIERESEINNFRAEIEANIIQHDKWVEQYNSLGGKIQQLNNQLDSKSLTGIRAIK